MQITIDTDGVFKTADKLARFSVDIAAQLSTAGYVALDNARTILKVYPRKLPNQRYIRTGRLGRSWRIESASAYSWTLSNNARQPRRTNSYAKWVHGNTLGLSQARIHKNRWKIARVVIMRERQRTINSLRQTIARLAQREGLAP